VDEGRGVKSQIIWLHFSNNLEILLVNAFIPLNFCMTQKQSSVIKFSSFNFLPPEVSDSKARVGGTLSPQHFHQGVAFDYVFCPQIFYDTMIIFRHKFSFFIFYFSHLKSVITNLRWMMGINPQIIWLHSSNNVEIMLIILLVNAFVPPTFA